MASNRCVDVQLCFCFFFTDTIASWSYACFSKGRGRSESNTVIFHSNPPLLPPLSSRGILGRCWKQMVTGSNPARSLGNLYSAYPTPIKSPSCFQAQMNVSFRSPPLGPQVNIHHASVTNNGKSQCVTVILVELEQIV